MIVTDLGTAYQRFNRNVDKSGGLNYCWPWLGARNRDGYGFLKIGSRTDGSRKNKLVHRLAWIFFNGPIPKGAQILHDCDNPCCCNPKHLVVGDHSLNMSHKEARGRYRSGELAPGVKLTSFQVSQLRRLRLEGETIRSLAQRFGISISRVCDIVNWKVRRWDGFPIDLHFQKC